MFLLDNAAPKRDAAQYNTVWQPDIPKATNAFFSPTHAPPEGLQRGAVPQADSCVKDQRRASSHLFSPAGP